VGHAGHGVPAVRLRCLRLPDRRGRVVGGAAYYTDPGDVSRYIEMLTKLEALAVYGDDVRALLVELAPTTDQ